jgi:carboxyl-terminal processing protease
MKLTQKLTINLAAAIMVLSSFAPSAYGAEPIEEVRNYVENYYVDKVDDSVLHLPTINEILSKLDPYSVHFTAEKYQQFMNAINQSYVGIGIGLEQQEQQTIIPTVYPDSPAERAGLEEGDIIVSIDGNNTFGLTIEEIARLLQGEANTKVSLLIQRGEETKSVEVTREEIVFPTVVAEPLAGNAGYIYIASFNEDTVPELQQTLAKMPGIEHWIVDLRDNPGGYVDSALEMLGMFPTIQTALIVKHRDDKPQEYKAIPQKRKFTGPISLLINGNSASSSEIVAGALKATNNATLYGQTTFGKGLMQSLFELQNGDVLKLTTYRFYTPKGEVIQQTGITPHVKTDTPLEDAHEAWLEAKYKTYKQWPGLQEVEPTKSFTVTFPTTVNGRSLIANKIELIELGGQRVPINLKQTNLRQVTIQPTEPLKPHGEYMVVVHPGWKTFKGKEIKSGNMAEVDVQ